MSSLTIDELRRKTAKRFEAAGSPSAILDARLLVAHALNVEPDDLIRLARDPAPVEAVRRLEELACRRERGEPVAHLIGCQEFWSLPLTVTPATLIPRADSETLIEATVKAVPDRTRPLRILDLGTGSGCLLLALLSEYGAAWGLGIDGSRDALEVAKKNATYVGFGKRVAFLEANWADALQGRFDIIITNPPYIPRDDIARLQPEVRVYEPVSALDGGQDGLDAIRSLLDQVPHLLAPSGICVLEFGWDQADAVGELVNAMKGLAPPEFHRDLSGTIRCVLLRQSGGG